MLQGTYTALVTPFRDGALDEPAFERLVQRQVAGGVDGIVPAGTTGESPTLEVGEHLRVIELAVRLAQGRVQVIAGTGSNSTREAVHLTQAAERLGADASLQVVPYYNKPTQEGLFQHFKTIAESTRLPLVLYSIPGRCGVAIEVETVRRLGLECPSIVAIKEAGGDADRVSRLRRAAGGALTILSGDDGLTLPFLSLGAKGVISVASNLLPAEVGRLVRSFLEGRCQEAMDLHVKYDRLFRALFIETNPVPVKTALSMMGLVENAFRLPLVPLSEANAALLRETLRHYDLISA